MCFTVNGGKLEKYTGRETEVIIPDGVTAVCDFAFYCSESITSITMPDSVDQIGESAFDDCGSLTVLLNGGSFAEQYAVKSGLKHKGLNKAEITGNM